MFGLQNAAIIAHYTTATLEKDIYGSPVLASPASVSWRGWLEENPRDQRQAGSGDSQARRASFVTSQRSTLSEGDIISILPDTATGLSARLWRVESKRIFSSSVGIFRMELDLIEEVS